MSGHVIIAWSLMGPGGQPYRFMVIDEFIISGSEPVTKNRLTYRIAPYSTRVRAHGAAVATTNAMEKNNCVMTEEPQHWWFVGRREGLEAWLRSLNSEDFDAMFANTMRLGRTLEQSVA